MAITSDNMGELTARLGVARVATCRAGLAPRVTHLEGDGRLVFHRPLPQDGDRIDTPLTWTNGRE